MSKLNEGTGEPLKLYTSSEIIAQEWRKMFPGIEIVIVPKEIPCNFPVQPASTPVREESNK